MDLSYFFRGLLIGLAIAAPVGAIGLLCIRRTLADGRLAGFISGLGAATADAFYGAVAALGLTAVSGALIAHKLAITLVGGLFLCYLGVRTFFVEPATEPGNIDTSRRGLLVAYGSTLALTLTNPSTILSFVAIFAGLGLATGAGDRVSALAMVSGVFIGSALWWFVLSGAVGIFRRALTLNRLRWVNRVSGAMLFGLGLLAIVSMRVW
jgi:threonine/homoserine/homoserine lactone efflux protein